MFCSSAILLASPVRLVADSAVNASGSSAFAPHFDFQRLVCEVGDQ